MRYLPQQNRLQGRENVLLRCALSDRNFAPIFQVKIDDSPEVQPCQLAEKLLLRNSLLIMHNARQRIIVNLPPSLVHSKTKVDVFGTVKNVFVEEPYLVHCLTPYELTGSDDVINRTCIL